MSDSSSVGSVHLTLGVDDSQLLKQMTAAAAAAATAMQSKLNTAMNLRPAIDFSVATKGLEDAMKQSTTTIVGSVESLGEVIKELVAESISTGAKAGASRMADVKMPSLKLDADKSFYETQLRALEQGLDNTNAKIHVQIQSIEEMKRAYAGLSAKGQGETPAGLKASAEILRAEENLIKMQAVSDQTVLKIKAIEDAIANLGTNGASATSGLTQAVEQAQQAASASIDQALDKTKAWEASTKQAFDTMRREAKSATSVIASSTAPAIGKVSNELEKTNTKLKSTSKHAASARSSVDGLANSSSRATGMIGRLGKAGLALMGVRTVFAAIRRVVASTTENIRLMANQNIGLANTMNSLTQATDTMKGAFAAAVAPIMQALAPALQWLAAMATKAFNAIAMFFAALTGKKSVMQAVGSTKQFTKATEQAVKTSTAGAKKTEKAWKRVLAPFDEITALAGNAGDAADGVGDPGGGGGGIGGLGDVGPIFKEVGIDSAIGDMAQKVLAWFDKIKTAADPTIEAFKRLVTALEPLKTFAFTALKDFYNSFLVPVGKWVLGTGLPKLFDTIGNLVQNINWQVLNDGLKTIWERLAPFAINVGEGLLWFFENVLSPLAAWTMNEVVPIFLDMIAEAIRIVNNVLEALKPLGQWLYDEFLVPIASWTGGVIVSVLEKLSEGLTAIGDWIQNHQEAVRNITVVIGSFALAWGLVTAAVTVWNVVAGIGSAVTTALGAAVAFLTSPIGIAIAAIGAIIAVGVLLYKNWDTVKEKATEIWGYIKDFFSATWNSIKDTAVAVWNGIKDVAISVWNSIKDFFVGLWQGLSETASSVWNGIKDAFSTVFEAMATIFSGFGEKITSIFDNVKTIFSNIIGFIKNVFTGNWKGAWQNVVNIFTTIFDGLKNAVKTPINWIIDKLNSFLGGLNKIKIPDWVPGVGGKGFNIPNIPRLATGGIVDSPTVAMVGERGKEAVMPLENNTGWIRELAREIAAEIGGGGGDGELTANIYLGDEILDRVIAKLERKARQRNKPILT